jgi:hypothetical protein
MRRSSYFGGDSDDLDDLDDEEAWDRASERRQREMDRTYKVLDGDGGIDLKGRTPEQAEDILRGLGIQILHTPEHEHRDIGSASARRRKRRRNRGKNSRAAAGGTAVAAATTAAGAPAPAGCATAGAAAAAGSIVAAGAAAGVPAAAGSTAACGTSAGSTAAGWPPPGWWETGQYTRNGQQLYAGICTSCGGPCTVPFQPLIGHTPPCCTGCHAPGKRQRLS